MTVLQIILGLLLLDVIVFFHELGHFAAARISGVKVEAFSLGMGPVLLHKKIRGTDFRLSLFPVGGYCSMKGEAAADFAYENPEAAIDKDSFYGTKAVLRAFIGAAGPFANVVFTFIAFVLVSMIGYTYYSAGNTVRIATDVYPEMTSAAGNAGIKSGDKIIKINSTLIADFSDLYTEVAIHPDEDILVEVDRNGEILKFSVHTEMNKNTGEGKIGVVSDPSSVEKREAKTYGFFGAVINGAKETGNMIYLTIKGIATLFKGVNITESVSGPARVTSMLGETAQAGFSSGFRNGFSSVLQFMALISISLFIMNLLPIPVLDGFLVLTSLVEAVFKYRVSPKMRNIVQFVGITLIALLFLIAAAGDFHYFAELINGKK